MSPDEHSCLDFKENIEPLRDEYLATMANAAALADEPKATVLVGVAEERNPKTGTTSGRVVGLSGDLHRMAETIAQRASMTEPTPVGIEIFEENVSSKPILRVEIAPRMPPHYDQRGRRATRQHTTTRAMSDEEILKLLEAREQRRYAGVAEETANLMMGDLRVSEGESCCGLAAGPSPTQHSRHSVGVPFLVPSDGGANAIRGAPLRRQQRQRLRRTEEHGEQLHCCDPRR